MRSLLPALLAAGALGCSPPDEPAVTPLTFTEVSSAWGVEFTHDAGRTPEKHLPETMGAGAVLFDMERDGDLDLYLVQGGPLPGMPGERKPNRLYAGAGDGRFWDVTSESGAAAHEGYGMGAAAGDVDGDGFEDLYVANLGPDVLLVGDGRGRFEDRTRHAGLGDERWTSGALFFDADADGDLDLYVCAYLEVDLANPTWCGRREEGWRSYCHPDHYEGLQDRFYVNDGDGRFEERAREAGLVDEHGKGLGVVATDIEGDGDLDLYVANDSVENKLWLNRGDGTFEDGTLLSGTGVNTYGATEAGMGLAVGDVEGDGRLDLYVTNFDDESNTLYHNEGDGLFRDVTAVRGLEAPTRLSVGFGTVLCDFDHDGDLDIAVANGHIIDNIELYHDGKSYRQPTLYFENDGEGRFRAPAGGVGDLCGEELVGRGLYSGDLDGDGDLDLVLTQCGGPARIYRNDATLPGSFVIEGLPAGARCEVEYAEGARRVLEAGGGPSYFGRSSPHLHLPHGGGLRALTVRAPGGEPRVLRGVEGLPPGRYVLDPGADALRHRAPR